MLFNTFSSSLTQTNQYFYPIAVLAPPGGWHPLLVPGQRGLGYNSRQIGGKISDRIFSAWSGCLGLQTVESLRQWRPQTTLDLWSDIGEGINMDKYRFSSSLVFYWHSEGCAVTYLERRGGGCQNKTKRLQNTAP